MSLFFFPLWFCLFFARSLAGSDSLTESVWICPKTNTFAPNSSYERNHFTLTSIMYQSADQSLGFFHTVEGHDPDAVCGLFLCRGDQSADSCQGCVASAIDDLDRQCAQTKVAIVWNPRCMVRYSNKSFFGIMDESPGMYAWNWLYPLDHYTSNTSGFWQLMLETVGDLAKQAAEDRSGSGKKYAIKEADFGPNLTQYRTLHAYAQCTPDLTVSDCYTCLQDAIKNISISCNMMVGCWMMFPSCTVRYDVLQIYTDVSTSMASTPRNSVPFSPAPVTASPTPPRDGGTPRQHARGKQHIIVGAITAALVVTLLLGLWVIVRKRRSFEETTELDDIETTKSLKFDYCSIRTATNDFSEDRKLGEGGFGDVFQGVLKSEQEIAVKRLTRKSRQGIDQFKTEVILVAKLQHKNLAQLLGFCITATEKLLVYEFLPNSSLDKFLFDSTKCASLDWETRYKIICGIAKGLLYLHEDSRLKIIHRDLKPSNVLLDKDMNPKISDFGLARLFDAHESHANTIGIAGTLGYMTPEYLKNGNFSIKSDVYSFGVMVLEIVSGQRNNFGVRLDKEALLHRAWRLWKDELPIELLDSRIGDKFCREEVAKCIQIGLLCIQEDAVRRPSMASVFVALSGDAFTLGSPKLPGLFRNVEGDEIRACGFDQNVGTFTGSESITYLDPR